MVIQSCMSTFKRLLVGVSQGSILGPIFSLIIVDDISERLLSLTRSFANDSSLFCSAASIQDIESIINHDLRILISRANQWLIKLNPSKTEAILFTLRHFEKKSKPYIQWHPNPVRWWPQTFRLTERSNGEWHSHIDSILSRAVNVIRIMRKL